MSFVCRKPIRLNAKEYRPGEIIPDGIILPERIGKLKANGCIVESNGEVQTVDGFTQAEVDARVAEAIEQYTAELKETELGAFEGTIPLVLKTERAEAMSLPLLPEELQETVDIMQMNADEGAKAVANIQKENVLILLHAIDSRKTIKDAAKKQAGTLFSAEDDNNAPGAGNGATDPSQEG